MLVGLVAFAKILESNVKYCICMIVIDFFCKRGLSGYENYGDMSNGEIKLRPLKNTKVNGDTIILWDSKIFLHAANVGK